jgi:DNA-directed RNA polymerase specialized sigma24 family protein
MKIDRVERTMAELPPMQRACFEMVVLRGISTDETAAMHGISESTVRQHVFRARKFLGKAIDAAEEEGAAATEPSDTPLDIQRESGRL